MKRCKTTSRANPAAICLAAALLTALPVPLQAGSAVADAAGRVMAYFYAMEELAAFCQAVLPTAAPGLGVSFAGWQARNAPELERVQERFAIELAADMGLPVVSPEVQRELRGNLRATRNATAEFQRDAIRNSGEARARESCVELDTALATRESDIDKRNPDDWVILFARAPANPADVIGDWSTSYARCGGEVWTLHADGREQLSVLDPQGSYGYVGNWSLADGLYRSQGVDDRGASVKQLGTIETDPGGTLLTVTISQQSQTLEGETQTLVTPERAVTVQYFRCDDAAQPAHYDFSAAAANTTKGTDEGTPNDSQNAETPPPTGAESAGPAAEPTDDGDTVRRGRRRR